MRKPQKLYKGDKVAIVSLSSGVLGENFCKHELDLAINRLKGFGLIPTIMPSALKGIEYLQSHPEKRAEDLKSAFADDDIKAIICAIGGDDTYRLVPFLMSDIKFIENVRNHPKIFTGFSDTTINHLMFQKIGMNTFYGPNILCDLAELDNDMLPYTKEYFELFFNCTGAFEIKSSDTVYFERESYGKEEIGTPRKYKKENHGYEVLNGRGIVTGQLLGGCVESIYEAYCGSRYKDEFDVLNKYDILPSLEDWKGKILFLETSEEQPSPDDLKIMLEFFLKQGIFNQVNGLIVGKPIDEVYYDEYKLVYKEVFEGRNLPVMYNLNFGHCSPRCILPYGIMAELNVDNKTLTILENPFD
ncbi:MULTISPECIES: S66 peptidase family protein [unclassified Ruminococcus]|uniref:S66 family peptidase n=1 Tax=unclassified Ruminococcus TaxID=2608920 RepID=UPI002108DC8C|nr:MULTISPECIES: S66 peptidase family protein [unclassified Ruminococcus]MCQ4021682.1 LD-carboxypeptidase [Ruminococcus sp. zg-924]MCQ4114127.1 LD-carboxypeptidase [Ruminococcus sp. zg-921]